MEDACRCHSIRSPFPGVRFFNRIGLGLLTALVCLLGMPGSGWAQIKESGDTTRFRMVFVGDLMCHSTQFRYASTGKDRYNFHPSFAEVMPAIAGADLAVGNLETVLGGDLSRYQGYPAFNTPDAYLDAVDSCGFDFLVTANNHSLDQGWKGLLRTLNKIEKRGIGSTGTYRSKEDRDSVRIVEVAGTRIGFLNYTYGTNGKSIPAGKPWSINLIDTLLIRTDIAAARKAGAELVIVVYHYGLEKQRLPGAEQKMAVETAIANGADLVIGSHPHVLQPVSWYATRAARMDTGLVVWSLGNFISNQYWRYTDAGMIMMIEISRTGSQLKVSDAGFIPTWVYRGRNPEKKIHVIYPSESSPGDSVWTWLEGESNSKRQQSYTDSYSHVRKYSNRIRMIPREEWETWKPLTAIKASEPAKPVKKFKLAKLR